MMTKPEANKSAAHDVVEYLSLWLKAHDPEFGTMIMNKNFTVILTMMNNRYGSKFDPKNITVAELLYWIPVYIESWKEARQISKRRIEHRKRMVAESTKAEDKPEPEKQPKALKKKTKGKKNDVV